MASVVLKDVDVKNNAVVSFGELFVTIYPYLKKPVSAEYISREIKVKPSRIRAVLNKLYNHSLIDYKRCFDDDTGKYTYIWTLNHKKLETFLKDYNADAVSENAVASSEFPFICSGCKEPYSFESAVDCAFKCHKCGSTIDALE